MTGSDADILCGEWQTGSFPQEDSEEKYNIKLEILEVIQHPDFDTTGGGGGPRLGNDIAVFIVDDSELKNHQNGVQDEERLVRPVCLPGAHNTLEDEEILIHSGWNRPPPISLGTKFSFTFKNYLLFFVFAVSKQLQNFFEVYGHLHKQWHFRMKKVTCEDFPVVLPGDQITTFLTNTYYPASTVCTQEDTPEDPICLTGGESGSPLMSVIEGDDNMERYTAEGVMSFTRSCLSQLGKKESSSNKEVLKFTSISPNVYTRLSCFLPWVAGQYNLTWEGPGPEDPKCTTAEGDLDDFNQTYCGTLPDPTVRDVGAGQQAPVELPCVFPYFYDGKYYDGCLQFSSNGFIIPAFFCPVFNSTEKMWHEATQQDVNVFRKSTDINNAIRPTDPMCIDFDTFTYNQIDGVDVYNIDVNPDISCSEEYQPFVQCRENCKGGKNNNYGSVPELCSTFEKR